MVQLTRDEFEEMALTWYKAHEQAVQDGPNVKQYQAEFEWLWKQQEQNFEMNLKNAMSAFSGTMKWPFDTPVEERAELEVPDYQEREV